MLYNNGDKFGSVYYQGNPVSTIYVGGKCVYPANADITVVSSSLCRYLKRFGDSLLNTVTAIRRSYSAPTSSNNAIDVCNSEISKYPIYMWISQGILYWYSLASKVYTDTSFSFGGTWYTTLGYEYTRLPNCTDIQGIGEWDTSRTTELINTFLGFSSLSDISPTLNWDLSKVYQLAGVFRESSSNLDISTIYQWNLSNLGMYSSGDAFNVVFRDSNINKFDFSMMTLSDNASIGIVGGFEYCLYLTICDIGFNVYRISRYSFYRCLNLTTLICRRTSGIVSLEAVGYDPFEGASKLKSSNGTVYVPQALLSVYQDSATWKKYLWNYGCMLRPLEGSPYEQPGSI